MLMVRTKPSSYWASLECWPRWWLGQILWGSLNWNRLYSPNQHKHLNNCYSRNWLLHHFSFKAKQWQPRESRRIFFKRMKLCVKLWLPFALWSVTSPSMLAQRISCMRHCVGALENKKPFGGNLFPTRSIFFLFFYFEFICFFIALLSLINLITSFYHILSPSHCPGLANRTAEKTKPSALDLLLLFKESVRMKQLAHGSKKVSIRDLLWSAIGDYNKMIGSHREPWTIFMSWYPWTLPFLILWIWDFFVKQRFEFVLLVVSFPMFNLSHGESMTKRASSYTTYFAPPMDWWMPLNYATTSQSQNMQASISFNMLILFLWLCSISFISNIFLFQCLLLSLQLWLWKTWRVTTSWLAMSSWKLAIAFGKRFRQGILFLPSYHHVWMWDQKQKTKFKCLEFYSNPADSDFWCRGALGRSSAWRFRQEGGQERTSEAKGVLGKFQNIICHNLKSSYCKGGMEKNVKFGW